MAFSLHFVLHSLRVSRVLTSAFLRDFAFGRYANISVGIQEKLVLQRKAQQAMERGEPVPDLPGMQEALDDKDLMRKKEEIAANNKSLMRGKPKETELQKKGSR